MINASSMSMGFLRSLYFEQVKKSVADAKEKEAKEKEKEAQEKARISSPGYDRANQRLRQESIKRYNNRTRQQQQTQKQSRVDLPSMSNEDLEDALEELE